MLVCDAFDIGHGVVLNLFLHRTVHLTATHGDGVGGSDVGSGGHRGHMGGHREKDTGRGGAAS